MFALSIKPGNWLPKTQLPLIFAVSPLSFRVFDNETSLFPRSSKCIEEGQRLLSKNRFSSSNCFAQSILVGATG